jgi:hypothetical protein
LGGAEYGLYFFCIAGNAHLSGRLNWSICTGGGHGGSLQNCEKHVNMGVASIFVGHGRQQFTEYAIGVRGHEIHDVCKHVCIFLLCRFTGLCRDYIFWVWFGNCLAIFVIGRDYPHDIFHLPLSHGALEVRATDIGW